MLIFAIDDEPAMLAELHDAIAEAEPNAEIADFETAPEVLAALDKQGRTPDVVFSDIRLPGMDGLSLAVQIKNRAPKAKLVFVTGYAQYAMEAYKRHVNGYVMKPVTADRIREELDALGLPPAASQTDKLVVQCFGWFEVFWHGEPLMFQRKQTKELLAYLIDREGTACTAEEIASALWENEGDIRAVKQRIRNLLTDLRITLRGIGMEDVLIRERRQLAIRQDMVDCDYYRMREGDVAALNAFDGEYMKQYSWAELTTGKLRFT